MMKVRLTLVVLLAVASATPTRAEIFSETNVFVGGGEGPNGVSVYRLPGMAVANDGSIVAFAEARNNGQDPGHPNSPIAMVMKRSTDGGATWGPLVKLNDSPTADFSDPRAFVDRASGTIRVMYTQWPDSYDTSNPPAGLGPDSAQMILQTSTDNGQTFSSPVNITAQMKNPQWSVFDNAPGAGIQLQFQSDAARNGRLVSPPWRRLGATSNNLAIFSDDGGATWKAGAASARTGSEAAIVELTDGRLLMDVRGGKVRERTISTDGGATWGEPYITDIPVSPVHAALTRYSAQRSGEDRDRILFSAPLGNPAGAGNSRNNVGIWTSYDEGKTFINPVLIVAGYGGYSVVHRLNDGTIGLLYETVNGTAIQSVRFDLAQLEGPAHQAGLTHYDGFNNAVNRSRGGVGWSGGWSGSGHAVNTNQPALGGTNVPFANFRFDLQSGRMDLLSGGANEAVRQLNGTLSLDKNQTTYVSLLVTQKLDATTNGTADEFLRIELRDAKNVAQASFGVKDDESFYVSGLGAEAATAPNAMSRTESYFLVARISSQAAGQGKFDQISLKAFQSGSTIPDSDAGLDWTVTSGTGVNSSAVLNQLAIVGGGQATWSIDEVRIGSTFGAVASNLATGAAPNGVIGDVNQDGVIAGDGSGPAVSDDLTAFREGWQSSTMGLPPLERIRRGDLNLSGFVDLLDANILRDALAARGGGFDEALLPEPRGGSMAVICALTWMLFLR